MDIGPNFYYTLAAPPLPDFPWTHKIQNLATPLISDVNRSISSREGGGEWEEGTATKQPEA